MASAANAQDELLRDALNIEATDDHIPTTAEVVDTAIYQVLRDWQKVAVGLVGEEAARDSYDTLKQGIQPVAKEVEATLVETGKALKDLGQTRRDAKKEAAK